MLLDGPLAYSQDLIYTPVEKFKERKDSPMPTLLDEEQFRMKRRADEEDDLDEEENWDDDEDSWDEDDWDDDEDGDDDEA
jgi:hypothetical protein